MFLIDSKYEKLKASIAFKILRTIFLIYVCISIIFTLLHIYSMYKTEKLAVLQQLNFVESTFKSYIEHTLSNNNKELLKIKMNKLLDEPSIVGIKVVSYHNKSVLYDGGNTDESSNYIVHKFMAELDENANANKNKLVTIVIYSSNANIFNRIKLDVMYSIINFILEIIVLWSLFLWIGFNFALQNSRMTFAEIYFPGKNSKNNPFTVLLYGARFLRKIIKPYDKPDDDEEEIDDSEKYLRNVSDLIPSSIISLNRDCSIVHLNNAAEKFLGCKANEVIGKPIQSIIAELEPHMELIKFAIEHKQFKTFNKIKLTLDDNEHFLKIVAYPFKKTGVALYLDDVTEQVFMESLLVQTEKMTTLGTLAAGMAHEINNSLSGIIQSVQNITRRLDAKNPKNFEVANEFGVSLEAMNKYLDAREINQFLVGVRELGDHASVVVKNVLKFSRRSDQEMLKININSIIQDTLSIVTTDYDIKKQLKYQKLIIKTELDNSIPEVKCSPSEIEQVLLNLIKNAAHALMEKEFKNDDKPTISVHTGNKIDHIRIEVKDNGAGIPEQIKHHLFKPFFTTKPIGMGTGLGLSISHYIIVEKHHGKLYVDSALGVGTTFIIELAKSPLLMDDVTVAINA